MEFRIRETAKGFYIDLHTDNGDLVIEGANQYMSRGEAEIALRRVKEPVTYIGHPYVTEESEPSSWNDSDDDDYDKNFSFRKARYTDPDE